MTEIERIQPTGVNEPYAHYSTVSKVDNRVYVSGLVSIDEDGELLSKGDPRGQAVNVCRALEAICGQFDCDLSRVVATTFYITDAAYYQEANAGYAEVFGDNKPSRATVVVNLTNPDLLVELVSYIEL